MSEATPKEPWSLSRQDFEKDVILRSRADSTFRENLLANPKAAIQAAYGVEIPPGVEFEVLQETPSKFYLVLPTEAEEMTDEEVAAVAGGLGDVKGEVFSVKVAQTSLLFLGQKYVHK